jgi:hypothetical protein
MPIPCTFQTVDLDSNFTKNASQPSPLTINLDGSYRMLVGFLRRSRLGSRGVVLLVKEQKTGLIKCIAAFSNLDVNVPPRHMCISCWEKSTMLVKIHFDSGKLGRN